jgi:hypothetical protein
MNFYITAATTIKHFQVFIRLLPNSSGRFESDDEAGLLVVLADGSTHDLLNTQKSFENYKVMEFYQITLVNEIILYVVKNLIFNIKLLLSSLNHKIE